jgi:two-component system, cell cycle sensor histidine kinase DivJ
VYHVRLAVSVRDYLDSLVHRSARGDALAAARHRAFIAPRVLGGLIALAMLPAYLVARGVPTALEIIAVGWLVAPIGIAYFLSRSGRYEPAYVLSSLALTALITGLAMTSGGASSLAAVWLVIVPIEAALCASRRVVVVAASFAIGALGLLLALGSDATALISPPPEGGTAALAAVAIGSAILYATLLAFGMQAHSRTGCELLAREEDRYRLLAANMTDVITRHGHNGAVLFASPAAERLLNASVRELAGHGLFDRVHVGDRPAYLTALADAAMRGQERSAEFRVRPNAEGPGTRLSPQFIWVEMRCRALDRAAGDNGGAGREVVAVMRDITVRKAQEDAIQEARSEAEEANAAKNRFLATMSHELRTPLNAVIGFSEMLMSESAMQLDAAKRHEYARLIHDSGHHLLAVVNLVLDMSKIESGNFVITPEPFTPAAVIRHCSDLLALRAREAGLDLVTRLPADLPEIVADKRALKQMLLNLLSNAIKFTERGGSVTVSAGGDAAELAIWVEDTGVGISADDLPRLGDPFFQACASYDRPYDGTGLGLSIVKGLVGLHGGRMDIESRLGKGTRVTLRLPIDCENRQRDKQRLTQAAEHRNVEPLALPAISVNQADRQVKKRA